MEHEHDESELHMRTLTYMVIARSLINNKSVIFDCLTHDEIMDLYENKSRIYKIETIVVTG